MAATRPTILQIIPELETGGAELSTVEMAGAIASAGGRALVLSEGGRLVCRMVSAGGEFLPFPASTKNPARMLWNAREIARIIASEHVDLVHARSRAPAWSAMSAARRMGVPFVTTYHGAYSEGGRVKKTYNSVMARGDIVIANSRYTAALIKKRYLTPDSQLRVIYRGVDGAQFDPDRVKPGDVASLRRSWNVASDQKIVLQAARLTLWKGQSVLIAAAKILKDAGQLGNTVFVLAGDAQGRDGYRRQLEMEIAAANLGDAFRLPGHVDQMVTAYKAAHVTCIASTAPEAFGRTAAEAQVMGCPVIATSIGAPPETVLAEPAVGPNAVTGWLVPPGDAKALAIALSDAFALPAEARVTLGQRARAHVLEAFPLDLMRRQTLAVYDSLLHSGLEEQYLRGKRETSP